MKKNKLTKEEVEFNFLTKIMNMVELSARHLKENMSIQSYLIMKDTINEIQEKREQIADKG